MSSVTRRHALSTVAALAAVPALPVTALALPHADPIFAVIEQHRAVHAEYKRRVSEGSTLEAEIPWERRETVFRFGADPEFTLVETDDPRWIEYERALYDVMRRVQAAEEVFMDVEPATMAGLAAVLTYYCEHEKVEGMAIDTGDYYEDEDAPGKRLSWNYFFHEQLARAASKFAGAQS